MSLSSGDVIPESSSLEICFFVCFVYCDTQIVPGRALWRGVGIDAWYRRIPAVMIRSTTFYSLLHELPSHADCISHNRREGKEPG
jgi:hypothetical protein